MLALSPLAPIHPIPSCSIIQMSIGRIFKRAPWVCLTAVAAKGLDESWLGKELTEQDWSKLGHLSQIHGMHLTGEGGEYESFVLDAPHFKKTIEIEESRREWRGDSGRVIIEKASLR